MFLTGILVFKYFKLIPARRKHLFWMSSATI